MKKSELNEAVELLKYDIKNSVRRNSLIDIVEVKIKIINPKHKKIENKINSGINSGHYD